MARLVKKFGGTSIGDPDRIRNAAAKVAEARAAGDEVVVIVSAMGGMTGELDGQCREMTPEPDAAERDAVLAAGEQVTAGLFAMALHDLGLAARSWAGWQLPIETDGDHGAATITAVNAEAIAGQLAAGGVPVISGFQGLAPDGRVTTLGRGGSDLTAVAIAAAVDAQRCDIYTDVPGVYTADPNLVPGARKLKEISYAEMLEMASLGATVMQPRAVELASRKNVPVRVLSSFDKQAGTLLVAGSGAGGGARVSGLACNATDSRIAVIGLSFAGNAAIRRTMFETLEDEGIAVEAGEESDSKIVARVAPGAVKSAIRALHAVFALDSDPGE